MKLNALAVFAIIALVAVSGCIESVAEPAPPPPPDIGITDCGLSTTMATRSASSINSSEFEQDNVFVCMGQSMLSNCEIANAIVETTQDNETSFDIIGAEGDNCILRMRYGPESGIKLEELKKYATKHMNCPVDIRALPSNTPGALAFEAFVQMGEDAMQDNTNCTGTLIDIIQADANASDTNNIVVFVDPVTQSRFDECIVKEAVEKQACIKQLALDEEDENICFNLELFAGACIMDVAIAKEDSDICSLIENSVTKSECDNYFTNLYNADLQCYKIVGDVLARDSCYTDLAVDQEDHNLCKVVSQSNADGSNNREDCFSAVLAVEKNVEICGQFLDYDTAQACYTDIAEANLEISPCDRVDDTTAKDSCIKYVAEQLEDSATCKFISEFAVKTECLAAVAASALEKEACDEITAGTEQDDCYKAVAEDQGNAEVCKSISTTSPREDCYLSIAIATTDANVCAWIGRGENYETCYATIADANNNYVLCEKLELVKNYLPCFVDIAVALDQPEVCLAIERDHVKYYSTYPTRDLCYNDVAIDLGTEELCEEIRNEDLKAGCIDGNSNVYN